MVSNNPARKDARVARAKEGAGPETSGDPVRPPSTVRRFYERFLGLPAAVVLAAMWVAGLVVLGSLALALYAAWWVVVRLMEGLV